MVDKMKLSDFSLLNSVNDENNLKDVIAKFNQTGTDYPADKTVHQIFSEQAEKNPDAIAVIDENRSLNYGQLDEKSNQLANFLIDKGLQSEDLVAVMIKQSTDLLITLLAILKAGGAYLPIENDTPFLRRQYMLEDANTRFLIFEKLFIRDVNKLQWECPKLQHIFCINSHNIYNNIEQNGKFMDEKVWDYVGQEAFDDISGGGWKDSYTGEWLSKEVMDEYGENIRIKLTPYLNEKTRIIEIGCSSGISMFRLAPKVNFYCGTDLSADILTWTKKEQKNRNINNIKLKHLAAHNVHLLNENNFQIAIINSVLQCFSGHNYLRDVLRKLTDLMGDNGLIFLGNVWDQDKKQVLKDSLQAFNKNNNNKSYRTKMDHSEDLFVSRQFLEDLRYQFPEIASIEYSTMLGKQTSELSLYGYDAIIHIDKNKSNIIKNKPNKYQFDYSQLSSYSIDPVMKRSHARSLAYVIYTSGTTGKPKGTLIEHRSIVRLVMETNYIQLKPSDRILQTGSLAFDASTFEIWGALLNGASFYRPSQYVMLDAAVMKKIIDHYKITTMWLTSSLFNQLIDNDISLFSSLKYLLIGGEKLSPKHVNRMVKAYPDVSLINGYGPTENTTFTTYYPINSVFYSDIPIGKPISNTEVLILDSKGELTPIGVVGEICISGDGLSRGYLNNSALTKKMFRQHPFSLDKQIYYSGDLGRWLKDGNIEFMGRKDEQVKLRGFRVELNEIKNYILQYAAVKDACVILNESNEGNKELLAYVCFSEDILIDELRKYMKNHLPDYMIPAHFVSIEKIPLSANGKLDKNSLPSLKTMKLSSSQDHQPPETEIEKQLAIIWENILDIKNIGLNDSFFDVGGHSLKVTKLIAQIHSEMGIELPLATIFKSTSLKSLADSILEAASFGLQEVDNIMVQLNVADNKNVPNVFAFPPGTGDAIGYLQLAQELPSYNFYAFNFIVQDTRIADYVEYLSQVQYDKPYVFIGYSAGGNLAYHVAKELERKGQHVSDIIMIDSAQVCQQVNYPELEVRHTIERFLNDDSIKPYLNNYVLKEKAEKIIKTYYHYMSHSLDKHIVQANIHLLQAEDGKQCYWSNDEEIKLLFSKKIRENEKKSLVINSLGWKELTTGQFILYQGEGTHNALLYHPRLKYNAKILHHILDEIFV